VPINSKVRVNSATGRGSYEAWWGLVQDDLVLAVEPDGGS